MKLRLIEPTIEYEEQVMEYKRSFLANNDSLAGGSSLKRANTYLEWLEDLENKKINKPGSSLVPSTSYLAVDENNKLIGLIDLRHTIDHPILSSYGGHVGYSVAIDEREKGYAKEMLRLVLLEAKKLNITKLLLTCQEGNIASEKTIIANGGVFDKTICVEDKKYKRFYISNS